MDKFRALEYLQLLLVNAKLHPVMLITLFELILIHFVPINIKQYHSISYVPIYKSIYIWKEQMKVFHPVSLRNISPFLLIFFEQPSSDVKIFSLTLPEIYIMLPILKLTKIIYTCNSIEVKNPIDILFSFWSPPPHISPTNKRLAMQT